LNYSIYTAAPQTTYFIAIVDKDGKKKRTFENVKEIPTHKKLKSIENSIHYVVTSEVNHYHHIPIKQGAIISKSEACLKH